MSGNVGTLFLEARQTKKLSVDAAAEAIHVKAEYIQAIEDGAFDFNLPDIYKRGFYRSYANFLGLDEGEAMAKCPIKPFETLESYQKRREMVSQVAKKTQEVNHDHIKTSFGDDVEGSPLPSQEKVVFYKKATFKMAGIILGSLALLSLALYGIIAQMGAKKSPPAEQSNTLPVVQKKIIIRASGDAKVIVRDGDDKSKIFSGTLSKGREEVIAYKKPIQVYFDRGEALVIEMDSGEYLHPESGRGGLQIK
ncbi:MAG: helix-turn-helix domain-containing protein [Puniceicoccales bacterium]|jgi:hypothetical protein|nr:helix-turn-helix domain-containing protein [Puniceicoccales bacterium]